MIRATSTRIQEATAVDVNEEILRGMEQRVCYYASHKEDIGERLRELDREWDIERFVEVGISSATMVGLTLGMLRSRRWLVLPAAVAGFVLYFALQGWAPPVPVLRRLGIRTHGEIEQERYALKMLRGDFPAQDINGKSDMERVASILRSARQR